MNIHEKETENELSTTNQLKKVCCLKEYIKKVDDGSPRPYLTSVLYTQ